MSQQDDEPIQPKMCPECCKTDRTVDCTDHQLDAFGRDRPHWCERCNVPFKGSPHEFDQWQAAKAARAAERGEIAAVNRRGAARSPRPRKTEGDAT